MSRWGDEKTTQFIRLYRQYECLWNPSSTLYKKKIARHKAYTKIQEEFKLSIKEIKNKIKSLRSTYHQELNKVRKSKLSGAEYDDVYKPSLTWFKEMDFLNDTFEHRPPVHSKLPPSAQTSTATVEPSQSSSPTNTATIDPPESSSQPAIKNTVQNKRKRIEENETTETLQRLEKLFTAINNPRLSNEDEFYYFGQSVAAQLRSLPLNNALDLQSKIQMLISKERSQLSASYSAPFHSDPLS